MLASRDDALNHPVDDIKLAERDIKLAERVLLDSPGPCRVSPRRLALFPSVPAAVFLEILTCLFPFSCSLPTESSAGVVSTGTGISTGTGYWCCICSTGSRR